MRKLSFADSHKHPINNPQTITTTMLASRAVARRALLVSVNRISSIPAAAAAFSTQTQTQIDVLEKKLQELHWKNVKDNVEELRLLMNEPKTNHAVTELDDLFKADFAGKMAEIQEMVNAPAPNRDEVDAVVFGLKKTMRGKMYGYGTA